MENPCHDKPRYTRQRGRRLSAAEPPGELWRPAVKALVAVCTCRPTRWDAFWVRPRGTAVLKSRYRNRTRLAGFWCLAGHLVHLSSENWIWPNGPAVRQYGVTTSCPLSGCSSGWNTCGLWPVVNARGLNQLVHCQRPPLSGPRIHYRQHTVKRRGWGDTLNARFYIRAKF